MEGKPLVTVIIIFLNAEKFIDEAIASVLAQSYETWELLLVDDGSTDASTALAKDRAQRHPGKIRYLGHPAHENRGMSASRNRGLQDARGEFVAFLDADDVWLPNKLEEQLSIMAAQPRAAMVYGRTEIWLSWTGAAADRGRDYTLPLGVPEDTLVEPPALLFLLLENKVQSPTTCSALMRHSVFAQIGGFQDAFRGMFEDQAFFTKLCLIFPVFVSGRCWARYRQHPESCCAIAEATGTAQAARLPLLRWIEAYLDEQRVTDVRVHKALKKEVWPYDHPILASLAAKAQRIPQRIRQCWASNLNRRKTMRILVEPSDYVLRNAGDMAMMQVAVERLSTLWPQASIQIFSDAPERMPAYAPNARALLPAGRRIWYRPGFLPEFIETHLPKRIACRILRYKWVTKRIAQWEQALRRKWPRLLARMLRRFLRRAGQSDKDLNEFVTAVSKADLVIATGMGGITDAFPEYAAELLDTMRLAKHYRARTAMVGQGMGPLRDPHLWEQAKSVLPHVDFISLREERASGPLLLDLGVRNERVMTTGDDAIELAYAQRPQAVGTGFGINLRLSDYAEVNEQLAERLRPVLQTAAGKYHAPMVGIPISEGEWESDTDAIKRLMHGYGNQLADRITGVHSPSSVIGRIQCCRLVVTGSYHAAVFALSMGVPAIGLANSDYYKDKFLGLAEQFGPGCRMVLLHASDLATRLADTIDELWRCAEQTRPQLLDAAARQVELSRIAYRRIFEIVESQNRARHNR